MPPAERPLLIGITGNIGSGKSLFCQYLRESGLCVVSADEIAKQCLRQKDVVKALTQHFSELILADGEEGTEPVIDRRKLAAKVFSDPAETQFLNALIHPLVLQEFNRIIATSPEPYLGFEVPLLFEAGLATCFDYLVLVYAPLQLRLERLANRGDSRKNLLNRQNQQLADEGKLAQVDLVISNLGEVAALRTSAQTLVRNLPQLSPRDAQPFV